MTMAESGRKRREGKKNSTNWTVFRCAYGPSLLTLNVV